MDSPARSLRSLPLYCFLSLRFVTNSLYNLNTFHTSITTSLSLSLWKTTQSSTLWRRPKGKKDKQTHLIFSWSLWVLQEGRVSLRKMMGWPLWQTWKLGSLEATTTTLSCPERSVTALHTIPGRGVSGTFRFRLRDLRGSMMLDSKSPNPISWKPVFFARNPLEIIETSSCTG